MSIYCKNIVKITQHPFKAKRNILGVEKKKKPLYAFNWREDYIGGALVGCRINVEC